MGALNWTDERHRLKGSPTKDDLGKGKRTVVVAVPVSSFRTFIIGAQLPLALTLLRPPPNHLHQVVPGQSNASAGLALNLIHLPRIQPEQLWRAYTATMVQCRLWIANPV